MGIINLLPLIIAATLSLVVGGTVLARDYRRIENQAFFSLSLGIALWAIGIALFSATADFDRALLWAKFYYVAPLLIVTASVIFAQYFVYKKTLSAAFNIFIIAAGIIMAGLLIGLPAFVTEEIVQRSYGKQVLLNELHYMLYSAYLLFCFALTLILTYRKARAASQTVERQQINIFLFGFATSCALGILFNLVLPGLGIYQFIVIGPVSTTALAVAVGYAIVKHRLFDVKLVVARTIGYVSSLFILSLLYGFIILGLARFAFDLTLPVGVQIYLSIATGFAGLLFGKLRKSFDKVTNKLFYRDAYDPQELFDHLNKVLVSTVNLNKLLSHSSESIAYSLKAQYCAIGLREDTNADLRVVGTRKLSFALDDIAKVRKLTPHYHASVIAVDFLGPEHAPLKALLLKNDVSVLVRLSSNVKKTEEGMGYIVLGAKKSGNTYTMQDFKVLDTVAKELIIAIQNALRVEQIENFNITLQARIDEATRKLRRTNEKLKALDEAKDDFVSMASHQLRTPLTSIKGYTSMVLEGDAGRINATQRKLLEQSFSSSQRMVYLIADLLNVSRLKTGKFIIEQNPVNIAEIVEQEIGQLKEAAAGRSLELVYDMPAEFPTILLDETKTRQVIMNFIDNAIYYTPAGGHIKVALRETASSVEFKVVDDGIGVPKAERQHLFTKFYRAGNARTARPDGTGLGLFMAKKVIVAQGGAIIFESEEGKGSTFGFVFSKAQPARDIDKRD